MAAENRYEKLRDLVAQGRINAALDQLKDQLSDRERELKNEVSLQQARVAQLRHLERRGTQSHDQISTELNRIHVAVLDLIDEAQLLVGDTPQLTGVGLELDVFLSYRRADGSETARLIRSELSVRKLRAFLDVEDLGPGRFDAELLKRIESARNFIVILSAKAFAQIHDEDDWFRREIAHALKLHKRIVPILTPGFSFPKSDELIEELESIRSLQAIMYSHEYFDAMMQQLVAYLTHSS